MSLGDRAVSYVCTFAFGALLGMSLPSHPEPAPLIRNPYAIAESLGCQEVTRECHQHERQKRLFYRKASTK